MKNKYFFLVVALLLIVLIPVIMAESDNLENNAVIQNSPSKIAFASKRDGNFEIYTINDNGNDLKRLTNSKEDDLKPQWSPDGTKILFFSKKGKKYSLRVMNKDGSEQKKLANECNDQYLPSWSPDGTKILFVAKVKSKNKIFTIDPDGNNLTRLTEGDREGLYPSWSPDGLKILYIEKYQKEIFIYVMNLDGTGRVKLIREKGTYLAPAWSPDGRKIAYITTKQSFRGTYYQLYVMNSDGSDNYLLADGSRKVEDIDYLDEFFWSPDGTKIAFTKVADIEAHYDDSGSVTFTYKYGTYIVNSDGNDHDDLLTKIGAEPLSPNWSLDSSKLASVYSSGLMVYNTKSKVDEEIQVDSSIPISPVKWSSDGKKLVFAGKNHSFQKAGLYLVTLNGKVTKLTEANDYDPVWAPVMKLEVESLN